MDKNKKVRAIAFYLPQFYPTPENDEWWEPGFTEWTNVVRAKPLFSGHYQPRIPRDLGFYDLRVPETREKQAKLAREAGIEGFCYWHYWFGNGKRLLSEVFAEVVESGKPDFPFCLCWANHSWYQKTWDPTKPDKLLIEQTYPGIDDYTAHFMEMLPAFKDKRYMKTSDGKLIFGVFYCLGFDFHVFKDTWNRLAREYGLGGFYFFGLCQEGAYNSKIKENGVDVVVYDALQDSFRKNFNTKLKIHFRNFIGKYLKRPFPRSYSAYTDDAIESFEKYPDTIPCIDPDFDHSPRSIARGVVMHGSTPQLFAKLFKRVSSLIQKRTGEKIVFIKAWNEWGEGNYMEPDYKWNKGYIEEFAKVIKEYNK